ncbi:hypothetical protein ES703_86907 [subsurface metagenome]
MVDEISVRIVPGCPATVLVETEEDKELVKAALGDTECGCLVRTEAVAVELAEVAEEAAAEVAEEAAEAPELVCSLEPEKPWEESVCGIVAEEAGRQAADIVMVRLREEGLIA